MNLEWCPLTLSELNEEKPKRKKHVKMTGQPAESSVKTLLKILETSHTVFFLL